MKLPRFSSEVGFLQRMIALAAVLGLLWFLWGRGLPPGASPGSPLASLGPAADSARPRPWLASTSPAITDTLVELGLAGHVVGRSPYCRSVPSTVPVVGDLRDFDAERLAIVRPDLLFVQPPLAGVDPALAGFCAERGIRLVEQRIDSFADVQRLATSIAEALRGTSGFDDAGFAARFDRSIAELERVATKADDPARAGRPKALVLVASEPFLAVGRANYLDELLAAADLDNAVDRDGWIETPPESILALEADVILGVAQSEVGAERIRASLEALPWPQGRAPPTGVRALPELLSPSLVAVRERDAIARLAAEARAVGASR